MKTIDEIIEELAREKGYPNVKLNFTEYIEILKKGHFSF